MDYNQLKIQVAAWTHRTDLEPQMDVFTQLTEQSINDQLRSREMEIRLPVIFDDTFYDLPADYLAMRAMHIEVAGARRPLKQLPPQVLDTRYSRATGTPRAFAIHASQMEIRPGIEATNPYNGELSYYKRVDSIVTHSTNDILTTYPMIYLSGMMVAANVYFQDQAEVAIWNPIFMEAIGVANKQSQAGRYVLPTVTGA